MGLLQPPGTQHRPVSPRAARGARARAALLALLLVLTGTACAPEVRSVPAESVAASEAADADAGGATASAGEPSGEVRRKPKRKPAEKPAEKPVGKPGAGVPAGTQRVTAGAVTFAAPSGWQGFDQQRLTEAAGREWLRRVANRMGLTFEQMMASVAATDLMLVSPEGAAQGFADNLNVVTIPGSMPGDAQLRQQFLAVGATLHGIKRTRTGLGDTASLAYDLQVGDFDIAGEVVMVEVGGRTTTVTVSALDRDVTRGVAELARDTLAAAR